MSLSTRDINNIFLFKCFDSFRNRLIDSSIRISRHIFQIFKSKLTACCFTPSKNYSVLSQSHWMGVSTCNIDDEFILEFFNFLRFRHEWTLINIQWKILDVSKTKLSAATSTKTIHFSFVCQHHCVHIPASCMRQEVILKSCNASWNWLKRVSVLIRWKGACIRMT